MKYNFYPVNKIGITSSYQDHRNRGSFGTDFGWFDGADPVYAPNDGVCIDNSYNNEVGYYIWLQSDVGNTRYIFRYIHFEQPSPIQIGQRVSRGQLVGYMGNGGTSSQGRHLHFETWVCPPGYKFNWNDRAKYAKDSTQYCFASDSQYIGTSSDNSSVIRVLGTPTTRDTSKNQIEVFGEFLRCREGAGLNAKMLGYIDYGIYNYTEKADADGYTWYNIGIGWIAGTQEDTKVYPKEEPQPAPTPTPIPTPSPTIEELEKQIAELTMRLETQKRTIEQQNEEIDQLIQELDNYSNLRVFVSPSSDYYYIKLNKGDSIYF